MQTFFFCRPPLPAGNGGAVVSPKRHKLATAPPQTERDVMADETLLPKDGSNTSSYRLAVYSVCGTAALGLVLVVCAAFSPYPEMREGLVDLLKFAVIPAAVANAGIAMQYINGRSKVSVAKAEVYGAINAAPQTTQAAGTQINVTQPTEQT